MGWGFSFIKAFAMDRPSHLQSSGSARDGFGAKHSVGWLEHRRTFVLSKSPCVLIHLENLALVIYISIYLVLPRELKRLEISVSHHEHQPRFVLLCHGDRFSFHAIITA